MERLALARAEHDRGGALAPGGTAPPRVGSLNADFAPSAPRIACGNRAEGRGESGEKRLLVGADLATV